MPVTTAFLNTCRTSIITLPEYTAFNTSHATFASASRADRARYWQATYGDGNPTSPAYLLRRAIRDTVTSQATITGGISPAEREESIRTLAAEYAPQSPKPQSHADEAAALQALIVEEYMA